jgi:hypothetical protein
MNEKLSRNESQHNNKNKLLSTEREKLVPLDELNFALFSLCYTTVIHIGLLEVWQGWWTVEDMWQVLVTSIHSHIFAVSLTFNVLNFNFKFKVS